MAAALAFALKYWRVIVVVVGLLGLAGGAGAYIAKVKHDAYAQGYADADAKCQREKAAQEAANRKAMEEATKALAALQQKLELKELQVDDVLKALDLAADAAPDAAACGLDADSVRRLSAFQ